MLDVSHKIHVNVSYLCTMKLNVHSNFLRLIRFRGGGGECEERGLCPTNYTVGRDHQNDKTLGWPIQVSLTFQQL